ncbi:MAG: hypothetical protein ACLSXO_00330 [Coprococcus sp.]
MISTKVQKEVEEQIKEPMTEEEQKDQIPIDLLLKETNEDIYAG